MDLSPYCLFPTPTTGYITYRSMSFLTNHQFCFYDIEMLVRKWVRILPTPTILKKKTFLTGTNQAIYKTTLDQDGNPRFLFTSKHNNPEAGFLKTTKLNFCMQLQKVQLKLNSIWVF